MNPKNTKDNYFLQLADELEAGDTSLKDLYQQQLFVDLSSITDPQSELENEQFAYLEAELEQELAQEFGEDFARHYELTHEDLMVERKVLDFNFTKSVMASVKEIAARQSQVQQDAQALEEDYFIKTQLDYAQVPQLAMAGASAPTNHEMQTQFMFSNNQADDLSSEVQGSGKGTNNPRGESIFSRGNMLVAFAAFATTLAGVFLLNDFNKNDGGFSTIASQQPTHAAPAVVATAPEQQVAQANTSTNNFGLSSGYQPVPLSDGIKYISLEVARPSGLTGLTLEPFQLENVQILLSTYEIQRRLAK